MNACRRIAVTDEEAYEIVSDMTNKAIDELQGVDVYTGEHPERGIITVVIPLLGQSLLLLP